MELKYKCKFAIFRTPFGKNTCKGLLPLDLWLPKCNNPSLSWRYRVLSKPPSHSEIKFVEKIYHQFIFADVEKPDTYNLAPPTFRTCSHLICLRGSYSSVTFRSTCSLLQIYFKITVLKKFAIFTGKHLCWSIFFDIKLQTLWNF